MQDLSIDTTVSATQYQFTLANQDLATLQSWAPRLVARLQKIPDIADVASDMQQEGLSAYLTIDRPTAARFGVTPATVDSALYDAFGQRIISTIFTQSNQCRVILDVIRRFSIRSNSLGSIYLPSCGFDQWPGAAIGDHQRRSADLAAADFAFEPIAGDDDLASILRPALRSARR